MSVVAVRESIINVLKAKLPKGTSVEPHGGRFDSPQEIKRFATKAPAVLVACVKLQLQNPGSARIIVPAGWAIFVLTRDIPQVQRDQGALALAEAVVQQVNGNSWGRGDLGEPYDIEARNLYSGSIDNLGIALWGVAFNQAVTSLSVDTSTLENFVTFHEDIDMAPADSQVDITQTTQLPQE